jgi:hypothetical protein
MQVYLKKHAPGVAVHSIKVEWSFQNSEFLCSFTVQKRDGSSWLSNESLTNDWSKNWGLWKTDVVEAFLQLRRSPEDLKAPYLELQVSPLNQPFALVITEPRKTFAPPKKLDFTHEVRLEGRSWRVDFKVTLPEELVGSEIYGGFFACLDQDPREYYALEPNPEINPDFHRPEFFLPLKIHE